MTISDARRARLRRAAITALSRAGSDPTFGDQVAENIVGELAWSNQRQLRRMLDDAAFRSGAEVFRTLVPAVISRATLDAAMVAALRVLVADEETP